VVGRGGENLVEAELGGAPDNVYGLVCVGKARDVHYYLILALKLYLRLRNALKSPRDRG
jgi:hypothetical protein